MQYPEYHWITALIILIAVLSDALDGYFARQVGQVSYLGKWLDPIADFIVIISVMLYLVMNSIFPGWFFTSYLLRHVIIACFSIYNMNYGFEPLRITWWAKWATGISVLAVFLHIFIFDRLPWLKDLSLYISAFLLLISFWLYLKQFIISIKDKKVFKNIKLALEKSRKKFYELRNIFEKDKISENDLLDIEEMLVESDLGYDLTQKILKLIRKKNGDELKINLKNVLIEHLPKDIEPLRNEEPIIFLIVGVNGTGKTTSSAKLTNHLIKSGCKVSLIAGDTYRAAAIEQLKNMGRKN